MKTSCPGSSVMEACDFGQIPCEQSVPISKEAIELKSHCETYKASIWRTPSSPNQPTMPSEDRATSTQIQKEKVSHKTQTG